MDHTHMLGLYHETLCFLNQIMVLYAKLMLLMVNRKYDILKPFTSSVAP